MLFSVGNGPEIDLALEGLQVTRKNTGEGREVERGQLLRSYLGKWNGSLLYENGGKNTQERRHRSEWGVGELGSYS